MKNQTIPEEITSIYKGKLSLAEALKDLDAVKKAFEISERIENRLAAQDDLINSLEARSNLYTSYNFVNSKLEDFKSSIPQMIKEKLEEFSCQYLTQLHEKVTHNEIEKIISNRCTWTAFNGLTQNLGSLKSRFEKHIFSDFEGLKTKMKVQFGDKYEELFEESVKIKEELSNFKLRMSVVEQKLNEMFVDDGLGESEDYDSQEENDNIMQNLDGNRQDSLESSDENEPVIPKVEPEIKPSLQIAISDASPKESPPPQEAESLKPIEKIEPIEKPNPPQIEIPAKIVEVPQEIPKKPILKEVPIKESPIINDPIITNPIIQKVIITDPVPEPVAIKPKIEINPIIPMEPDLKSAALKPNSPEISVHAEVSKPKPIEASTNHETTAHRSNALEVPDRASSRHKKGSSIGDPTLSRKNSMSSSVGVSNNMTGGLRNINKKLTALQKDVETNKLTLDEFKVTLEEYRGEFGRIYDKIGSVRERCEEIERVRQGMELSFIKALRRSGKDKKEVKAQQSGVSAADLKKIYSQISEKTQKLPLMESALEKSMLEIELLRSTIKEKINEVVGSLHMFESFRRDQLKDSSQLRNEIVEIQQNLINFNSHIENEVGNIKGPMTDLISDQQREREILEENLKRQQVQLREVVDEYSLSMKTLVPEGFPIHSRITTARPLTRKTNESPRVSVKHKFFETNNAHRVLNPGIKAEDNWLAQFPDGKTIALPKVAIKKTVKNSDAELKKNL